MKIEWMDGDREIPGHGLFELGKIYTVPDLVGKNLINQGQAEEVAKAPSIEVPKDGKTKKK